MANSLTVAGLETVGWTTNPEYHLGKADGAGQDFGEILPDTDVISSLLLDGDRISGERTGNRTWNLTIVALGSDRLDLATKVNTFAAAVTADTCPVVWTPDGCPSSVFTAVGRATLTVAKDFAKNGALVAEIAVSFETQPFARSLGSQTVTVVASAGIPQLQVDGMNSGSFTNGTRDTSIKYEGASGVSFLMGRNSFGRGIYDYISSLVGRTITAVDLSSYASASVRFRWPAPVAMNTNGGVNLYLTLTSAGGSTTFLGETILIAKGGTAWHLCMFDLSTPIGSTGTFDLTAVTQWQINVASGVVGGNPPTTSTAWIDDLRAYPAASVGNTTAEGLVLTVPAVAGSARTPVALEVARWPTVQASGNLLTAEDSSFEGATAGTWVGTNCALANSTTNAADGTHSLRLTSTAGGQMSASTVASGTMMTVAPNTPYTLSAASRAAATVQPFFVSVTWLDRAAAVIQTDATATVNDSTSAYVANSATITSPSEAAYAYVTVTYTGSAAAEVHRIDKIGLVAGSNQAWVIGTGTYHATATLAMANALIHSPPAAQDPDATILAALGAGTVTIPAANMNYDGTYSVIAFLTASGVSTRTIAATFTQKLGAATVSTTTLTLSVTGTQTLVSLGEVTLPLVDIPAENANSSLVIAVTSNDGSDIISDVALCDTQGQTVLVTGLAGTNTAVYVDTPDPAAGLGTVYASSTDRTNATSALANSVISGGPMLFEPGDNRLLVASTSGAPSASGTYQPAWLDEALV